MSPSPTKGGALKDQLPQISDPSGRGGGQDSLETAIRDNSPGGTIRIIRKFMQAARSLAYSVIRWSLSSRWTESSSASMWSRPKCRRSSWACRNISGAHFRGCVRGDVRQAPTQARGDKKKGQASDRMGKWKTCGGCELGPTLSSIS